jgi:hypothetical protein
MYENLRTAMDMYPPHHSRQDSGCNLGMMDSPDPSSNGRESSKNNAGDVKTLMIINKHMSFNPHPQDLIKSPIESRMVPMIDQKHFGSPDHGLKYDNNYNQHRSGNKRLTNCMDNQQMMSQSMLNHKNGSSPMRTLKSKNTESPLASRTNKTPAKMRSYSQQI